MVEGAAADESVELKEGVREVEAAAAAVEAGETEEEELEDDAAVVRKEG